MKRGKTQVINRGRHKKTTTAKENKGNVTRANKNSNGMNRGKTQVIGRGRHKNHDSRRKQRKCHKSQLELKWHDARENESYWSRLV